MFLDLIRGAPSLCFLWQCKTAWTTGTKGSMGKEPLHSPEARDPKHVLATLNLGTVIGTQDNVLVPMSAVKWRVKNGQLEVMTGRTWPNPGLSKKHERIRIDGILAGLCGGQIRPPCDCTTKVRVLLRSDTDEQG